MVPREGEIATLVEKIRGIPNEKLAALRNPEREILYAAAVASKEAKVSVNRALVTKTPQDDTGRPQHDTFIVGNVDDIDWTYDQNKPLDPVVFERLLHDALTDLQRGKIVYSSDRSLGADPNNAMNVRVLTDHAVTAAFADNMFRPRSDHADSDFTIVSLPLNKASANYVVMEGGTNSQRVVALDLENRIGLVVGAQYLGPVKKLGFTAMSYYLPERGVLPAHCGVVLNEDGTTTSIFGLSGTGKTTICSSIDGLLIGDDEHGWSDGGIFNLEGGCYAKAIGLREETEPEIYRALTRRARLLRHRTIAENITMGLDGQFDLDDDSHTENTRVSYPLIYIDNVSTSGVAGHPTTIIFLTMDTYGVLPPIAELDHEQALFHFLAGYTSKVAGTVAGEKKPKQTLSRFFGGPFMPREPSVYLDLFKSHLERHSPRVFLVNTGWTGQSYQENPDGRIPLEDTKAMVRAAVAGSIEGYRDADPVFGLRVPKGIAGVNSDLLSPRDLAPDKDDFDRRSRELADYLTSGVTKEFEGRVSREVLDAGPR